MMRFSLAVKRIFFFVYCFTFCRRANYK